MEIRDRRDTQLPQSQHPTRWRRTTSKPKSARPNRLDRPFFGVSSGAVVRGISVAIVSISLSLSGLALPFSPGVRSVFAQTWLPNFFFGERTLVRGLAGTDVVELQQRLQRWGYYNSPVTGVFDDVTERATIAFQSDRGLIADGEVGVNTQEALLSTPQQLSLFGLRRGDSGDRVLQLQEILQDAGYYFSTLDGSFGTLTEDALSDFQRANGLRISGFVNGPTELALLRGQTIFDPRFAGQEQNFYAVIVPVQYSRAASVLEAVRNYRPDAVIVESPTIGRYIDAGSFTNCYAAHEFAELIRDQGYEANLAYFQNRELIPLPVYYNPYEYYGNYQQLPTLSLPPRGF
ncbi:MAG: peptidoglycan-binding protein [Cyanobacteriota bacterium]|nr:peptidoglycan-binding protein [Cyanobacteriota bacterium]